MEEKKQEHYYRIKLSYKGTDAMGAIVNKRMECLAIACCYTDAEEIAVTLAQDKSKYGSVDIEIIRTKINEIAYNDTFMVDTEEVCGLTVYYFEESDDTEVGLYQVSLIYQNIDEKSGKTKNENSSIYVPAYSSSEAIVNVKNYLKHVGETREFTIRNVKYDKAELVLVTSQMHQNNIK